jgi:hypothetical protein
MLLSKYLYSLANVIIQISLLKYWSSLEFGAVRKDANLVDLEEMLKMRRFFATIRGDKSPERVL